MKSLSMWLEALVPAAMLALSCSAFAQESEDNQEQDEVMEHDGGIRIWTCRADARDGSGLFFLGMGPTRADSYVRALENCSRLNRVCTITCRPGPGGW